MSGEVHGAGPGTCAGPTGTEDESTSGDGTGDEKETSSGSIGQEKADHFCFGDEFQPWIIRLDPLTWGFHSMQRGRCSSFDFTHSSLGSFLSIISSVLLSSRHCHSSSSNQPHGDTDDDPITRASVSCHRILSSSILESARVIAYIFNPAFYFHRHSDSLFGLFSVTAFQHHCSSASSVRLIPPLVLYFSCLIHLTYPSLSSRDKL